MLKLFRLSRALRFLGIIPLVIGCCLDFDGWMHSGLVLRAAFGIIGAYQLLGPLDSHGLGWLGTLIGGLLLYLYVIRSGPLQLFTIPYFDFPVLIDGWFKITLRIIAVCAFILGFKDTYQQRALLD